MDARKIKLVAFDLDGTLTQHKASWKPKTVPFSTHFVKNTAF